MHFLNKKLFDMFNFLISLAYIFPIGWIMTRGNMLFANVVVYPASKPLCINYQQLQLTLPNWAKGYSFPSAKLRLQWNKTKPSSNVEFSQFSFLFVCIPHLFYLVQVWAGLYSISEEYESLTLKRKSSKSTTKTTRKIITSLSINDERSMNHQTLISRCNVICCNVICCKWESNVAVKKYMNYAIISFA